MAAKSFAALSLPGYRAFLSTYILAMMADNIEHVISYWVVFQQFHSPALGGFAVLSHWVPFLLFSFAVGTLNDRFDSRRLIQIGMVLFISVSLGWGWFFVTNTLTMRRAMVLLVAHGCAGVFWQTSSQMILHDIAGAENIQSAVRLTATGRYLGVLVGPAIGGALMLTLGPTRGIFVNTAFYLPAFLWLIRAPYGPKYRGGAPPPKRAVRGFADLFQTVRDVRGVPPLGVMIVLAGCASLFIGNSYQAQMPGFAHDMGSGATGVRTYSTLLAADAAGALIAGFLLETRGTPLKTTPATAVFLALGWAGALGAFALVRIYGLALGLLFVAGFFELSFSSMAQTLVQLNAPAAVRGRVLGLYNMSALGVRAFSGVTVGLMATLATIHVSLAGSAAAFTVACLFLLLFVRSPAPVALSQAAPALAGATSGAPLVFSTAPHLASQAYPNASPASQPYQPASGNLAAPHPSYSQQAAFAPNPHVAPASGAFAQAPSVAPHSQRTAAAPPPYGQAPMPPFPGPPSHSLPQAGFAPPPASQANRVAPPLEAAPLPRPNPPPPSRPNVAEPLSTRGDGKPPASRPVAPSLRRIAAAARPNPAAAIAAHPVPAIPKINTDSDFEPQEHTQVIGATAPGGAFRAGARVTVQWSDGRRYDGTVLGARTAQIDVVEVALPDGRRLWVPQSYVSML